MSTPPNLEPAANVVALAHAGAPDDLLVIIEDCAAGSRSPHAGAPGAGWKVLIVDDEPEVHQATMFALAGLAVAGRPIQFLHAATSAEARAVLAQEKDIALVLLDVVMETEDAGLRLVRHIRGECRIADTRIVLRTGQPGNAPELQVIQDYDINDYKTKSELTRTRLATTVMTAIRSYHQIRTIQDHAFRDPLCGLPNRNCFVAHIDEQAAAGREGWAVGIVDIDHFSETNNALGHERGDLLLKAVGERLRDALGAGVMVARVAGDGFGLFGRESDLDVERLLDLFKEPFAIDEYMLRVSASLGMARLADMGGNGLEALKNANLGLTRAKHSNRGRGRFHYYSPEMAEETRSRVKLAHDLRRSIDAQELLLYYQPQIALATGRPVGAEALLRWRTADGKFIPPDKFIPVAEHSGLIRPIGEWVLRTACRQIRDWSRAGLDDFRVAVNVSLDQFRAPGFTELVRSVLRETGISPGSLELEITESMAMDEVDIVTAALAELAELGVPVAIDDFGTGFSSLGHLQQLKVDRLKIDRRFVNELTTSKRSSIAQMIVELGHNLGLKVIAEGVETAEQAARLAALGCDEAQGYLYQRPVDCAAFEAWLANQGVLLRKPVQGQRVEIAPL